MNTVFSELGTAKTECDRIAAAVQRFLQATGRRPPAERSEPIRLALFGQYNSGKSTLVNALLRKRAAVTGDAPETKIAHVRSINGFEIADLPGGDARLQESEEALGALQSAHAVLYVISSATGLDYDTIWNDLKLLVGRGIPFLVVVNDKKPHQDEATERGFRLQLSDHFRELAASKLPSQDWTNRFFWVRAKSAERSRTEKKVLERLEFGSGIIPLDCVLTSILRDCDATARSAAYLRSLQDELRSLITALESTSESVELKRVEDALKCCDIVRSRLEAAANLVVEDSFGPLKDSISAVFHRATSGRSSKEAVESELTNLVRETYQGAFSSFRRRCENELGDLAARAEREIKSAPHDGRSDLTVHLGDVPTFGEGTMDPAEMREIAGGLAGSVTVLVTAVVAARKEGVAAIAEAGGRAAATAGKEGAKNVGKIISMGKISAQLSPASSLGGRSSEPSDRRAANAPLGNSPPGRLRQRQNSQPRRCVKSFLPRQVLSSRTHLARLRRVFAQN